MHGIAARCDAQMILIARETARNVRPRQIAADEIAEQGGFRYLPLPSDLAIKRGGGSPRGLITLHIKGAKDHLPRAIPLGRLSKEGTHRTDADGIGLKTAIHIQRHIRSVAHHKPPLGVLHHGLVGRQRTGQATQLVVGYGLTNGGGFAAEL